MWIHALPNAIVPTLNVTALNFTYLAGGVVIVEKVFGFPGFGSLMIDAIRFRDVPLDRDDGSHRLLPSTSLPIYSQTSRQ